jgi:6-phosphogluconate dehydrogenase
MDIAMIGLGRMGANMAHRLTKGGHHVVVYDVNEAAILASEKDGGFGARSLAELAAKLPAPRVVWLMVPAGKITDDTVARVAEVLSAGDTLVDGGNTYYKDDLKHAEAVKAKGIHFVDVGTSGGIWGISEGYSMMVGGDKDVVEKLRPIFETLAPGPNLGWGYVGPTGAGHFVKMVHNGIEYGLMQAYAEGFQIMKAKKDFALDVHQIAEIWRYGSVVRSWLLDLTANALAEDANLTHVKGWVADSGEGRWTVADAIELDVPAPIITLSLMMRFVSREDDSYAAKLLAAMRNQFGGHAIKAE